MDVPVITLSPAQRCDVDRAAGVIAAMAVIPGLQDGLACFNERLECVGWVGVGGAEGSVQVPVLTSAVTHDERRELVLEGIRDACELMGFWRDDPSEHPVDALEWRRRIETLEAMV